MSTRESASSSLVWDWAPDELARLTSLLEAAGATRGQLTVQPIGDGHSNLTFRVSDGVRTVVVRRPPPPPIPRGAHDVLREARVLSALAAASDVPVPRVIAVAEAGEVLDVPLYVMTGIDGAVITSSTPAPLDNPTARQEIAWSLVDTLAALHAVDWSACGLADYGRPEGYNRRHLTRMAGLIADADDELPEVFGQVHDALLADCPPESAATIVHNDFRLGNVIVAPSIPGRLAAVLDWELATLGDPMHDVAYLLASCPQPGEPLTATTAMALAMNEPGWPSRAALADRYLSASGRTLTDINWFLGFVLWKLAVLYEYGRRRAVTGVGDPYYADSSLVAGFLAAACKYV